jgi:glycosyltransferase involved in cell wall biosynthesis
MISIIIPCFNEEKIISDFCDELAEQLKKNNEKFECIFVDNRSTDETIKSILQKKNKFQKLTVIELSNYYGKESAMLSGLDYCKGDAIIIMDPDLEDPPKLIGEMIMNWKKGYDVVYTIRKTEDIPLIKKILKYFFYLILNKISNKNIPKSSGDFRLIDKKIKEQLIIMRERTRFLRGLVSFIGYKQIGIEFDRPRRKKGESKSNISFLIKYGLDCIFSYNNLPITVLTKIALYSMITVVVISFFLLFQKFFGKPPEGFTFTTLMLFFAFSFNIFALGILGEYISRIYDEVKKRPNYIIKKIH